MVSYVCNFRTKLPKKIFLIHGEPDPQESLKNRIEEETNIPVYMPEYGQEYVLGDEIEINQVYQDPMTKALDKLELIDKMQALENEIEDMKHALKEDIRLMASSDEDLTKLNNKVNELRKQIIEMMK